MNYKKLIELGYRRETVDLFIETFGLCDVDISLNKLAHLRSSSLFKNLTFRYSHSIRLKTQELRMNYELERDIVHIHAIVESLADYRSLVEFIKAVSK